MAETELLSTTLYIWLLYIFFHEFFMKFWSKCIIDKVLALKKGKTKYFNVILYISLYDGQLLFRIPVGGKHQNVSTKFIQRAQW